MAPGHNLVINELGATELEELDNEDIDNPDSLSILDPNKTRSVFLVPSNIDVLKLSAGLVTIVARRS
jgi:hypothetical protein